VSISSDVKRAVDETLRTLGGLDVVVNNAGVEVVSTLLDLTEEAWARINAVNVNGVLFGIQHGAPAILSSGGGAIVNVASIMGLGGCGLLGAYCATKAAVISLSRTAAVELRDAGVRVNALCPTFAPTAMVARGGPLLEAALGTSLEPVLAHVQGRLSTVREIAEAASFLASDRASFINGAAFTVDNALTARLI
jgi:NAD(P)-dependent dehydrogenase (short-subunit alcohol dehydrogenase family)